MTIDLSKLNCCQKANSYQRRNCLIFMHFVLDALIKITLSSIKNKFDTEGAPLQILTLLILPFFSAFLSKVKKPSAHLETNKGTRGHLDGAP